MTRFLTMALLGAVVLGASSVAYANVCAMDVVPAATLLFPFVPFDYDGGTQGQTTLFTITNVSSEAQIVHITVWSDYSVAILDFNVILTGYDVVQMNIRDILGDGILPGPLTGDTIWEEDNIGEEPVPLGPVSASNELWPSTVDLSALDLDAPEATWDGAVVGPPGEYLDCDPDWADGGWLSSPNNRMPTRPTTLVVPPVPTWKTPGSSRVTAVRRGPMSPRTWSRTATRTCRTTTASPTSVPRP